MSNDNNRTEQSPQDPQWRWNGVDTDLRNRPSPARLDEMRRCVPGQNKIVEPTAPKNEVAALCYNAGISEVLARRIVTLESRVSELEMLVDRLLKS
jgi:hypothetical protein